MRALITCVLALALSACGPIVVPPPVPTTLTPPPASSTAPVPTSTPPPTSTTPPPASTPPPSIRLYPWHTGIVSTTFWVGEIFNGSIADGSQVCSTYDSKWAYHWSGLNTGKAPSGTDCEGAPTGGCDGVPSKGKCATEARLAPDFWPTKVVPRENPFYLDLPFDDVNDPTGFKTRCQVIPWAGDAGYAGKCSDSGFSYMKNRWVHLVGASGRDCYGQVEDAGPSSGSAYHDTGYVFGTGDARPANRQFGGAGADVSPALNGCLGFSELDGDTDQIRWQFVDAPPAGPWTRVVTTSGVTP
jgi:hypothetical protein